MRAAQERLTLNRLQLEPHPEAGPALRRIEEILGSARPYGMLAGAADVISKANTVNEALLEEARGPATADVRAQLAAVEQELKDQDADEALAKEATAELEKLLAAIAGAASLAHIAEAREAGFDAADRALILIAQAKGEKEGAEAGDESETTPRPRRVVAPSEPVARRNAGE